MYNIPEMCIITASTPKYMLFRFPITNYAFDHESRISNAAIRLAGHARLTHSIHLDAQHIRVRVVARKQCREPLSVVDKLGHRTSDAITALLDHGRKVSHDGLRMSFEGVYDFSGAILVLREPHVANHFYDRLTRIRILVRMSRFGQILTGGREGRCGPTRVMLHFARAHIEAGHVGQLVVPLLAQRLNLIYWIYIGA